MISPVEIAKLDHGVICPKSVESAKKQKIRMIGHDPIPKSRIFHCWLRFSFLALPTNSCDSAPKSSWSVPKIENFQRSINFRQKIPWMFFEIRSADSRYKGQQISCIFYASSAWEVQWFHFPPQQVNFRPNCLLRWDFSKPLGSKNADVPKSLIW